MADGDLAEEALECLFCNETLRHAVFTNCGHSFCAKCILSYWDSTNRNCGEEKRKPVSCPKCRRTITMLIPSFSIREALAAKGEQAKIENKEELNQRINEYSDMYMKPADEKGASIPEIYEQVNDDIAVLDYATRTNVCYKYLVYATLLFVGLYLVSPVDLLSEAQLGPFGIIDDIGVILLGCW
eukprot:CAMPEP_0114510952 /NCGR_PEP_ID=MMETSP0109-20121206/14085_1 /TAXON_ID=29199 /ORGANISM="Chlorarachnion reptans, Strain CCCM449" /LENGTH=183 /DNA_ID=CAMNT_0001690341 /DNA_START=43 /DNA_END=591 /DNA_ORIENTATION=+